MSTAPSALAAGGSVAKGHSKRLAFARWTVAVIAARGIDAVLSFMVAVLLANRFGASAQLDAFFIARRATTGMTDLIRELVRKIAMPYIAPAIDEGRAVNWRTMPRSILAIVAVMVVLPALLIVEPALLVKVVAPGFEGEHAALATGLVRILVPLLPIAVITGLLLTYLQSAGVFFVGEASKALQRLVLVLLLVLFVPPLAVFGVAWTMLLGGILAAGVLAGIAFRTHRRRQLATAPEHPAGEAERADAVPPPRGRVLAALLLFFYHQLTVVIDFAFASSLQTGTVASLEYGTRLVSLIPGLVTLSVSTVLYPEVVRIMRGNDVGAKSRAIHQLMRGSLFVQVPCSLVLACAAAPLVQLLFGHGGFDADAQRGTIVATQYYAVAAIFLMPTSLAMNAIYSDSEHSPLIATLVLAGVGLALRAALLWGLVPVYGLAGLGLAVVLATFAMSVLSLWVCNRRFRELAPARLLPELALIAVCGLAGASAGYGMAGLMPSNTTLTEALAIVVIAGAAAGTFTAVALALRQPDMVAAIGTAREQWLRWNAR
ncbi:murein biosynthesis integral membrane protein MurJ [Novosphingobium aquimarinum]|uniref:murein biosynthesis integral membrane protein MurJ n=1 Tax=Novosphingobium aquimarinum TaxID=2682494 RepID=UPI0012EC325A|nr:lipid II flippase MurJ [Novosphingobium aquimarinum]